MGRVLLVAVVVALALGVAFGDSAHVLLLHLDGCGPDCEAIVSLMSERGSVEVHAQASGRVMLPRPQGAGLHWVRIDSGKLSYPLAQLAVDDRGSVTMNVEGEAVGTRPPGQVFVMTAAGKPQFFEKRVPFSWWGLVSSPMVAMGLVTVGMMIVLQFLLSSMGSVDEIRKELRSVESAATQTKKTK